MTLGIVLMVGGLLAIVVIGIVARRGAPAPKPKSDRAPRSGQLTPEEELELETLEKKRARPFWRRQAPLLVLGLAALVAAALLVRQVTKAERHEITGLFVLNDDEDIGSGFRGDDCAGTGGYDDVEEGLQVVVRDGKGEILATSELLEGVPNEDGDRCTFPFGVDVPDADFYEISVGRRGELSYSKDDLAEQDWSVAFTLGE